MPICIYSVILAMFPVFIPMPTFFPFGDGGPSSFKELIPFKPVRYALIGGALVGGLIGAGLAIKNTNEDFEYKMQKKHAEIKRDCYLHGNNSNSCNRKPELSFDEILTTGAHGVVLTLAGTLGGGLVGAISTVLSPITVPAGVYYAWNYYKMKNEK